jgi:hypothetical protein
VDRKLHCLGNDETFAFEGHGDERLERLHG